MTMQPDLGPTSADSPADTVGTTSPTQTSRKRKASSAGSRGVATLTPDQLAKKRANDREAQRAIRERTKQTIENLEQRIQDLTAQQPYQELQAVIKEKDAIQAENNEIRRRLSSIVGLIQPIVGAQGLTEIATAAHHNVQGRAPQSNNVFHPDSYVNGQQRPYAPPPPSQGEPAYPAFAETSSGPQQAWNTSRGALGQQRDNLRRGLELTENGERLSFNFLLDTGQRPVNPTQNLHPQHKPTEQPVPYYSFTSAPADEQRPWNTLPKNCEATCPLDSILLNLYRKVPEDNLPGCPASTFQHPPLVPSVMSLINPGQAVDSLSQTMADITTRFPHIDTIPNRVAVIWVMFVAARWRLFPTQENYERMPEWMHPRSSQLLTAHPAWIDYIPWPLVRDRVIANQRDYHFDIWFIPYTVGLSVNWPYGPMDCLLSTSENEDAVINPVFEKHIRKLDNWSLGPEFIETFPALKGTVNIRRQEGTREFSSAGQ